MERVAFIFVLLLECMIAKEDTALKRCAVCHESKAPPLSRIYRRYLMLYSSKERIRNKMVDFLVSPSLQKSAMPLGMRKRFNPQAHPAYSKTVAKEAAKELIEKFDIVPRIIVPKR